MEPSIKQELHHQAGLEEESQIKQTDEGQELTSPGRPWNGTFNEGQALKSPGRPWNGIFDNRKKKKENQD